MKFLKQFNEAVTITDEMKEELSSINQDLKLSDIEELFIDFIDDGTIKFIDFKKVYYVDEDSYTINYDEETNQEIKRPATYVNYKIYVTIEILDDSRIKEYQDFKRYLFLHNEEQISDMLGHTYSIFNTRIVYDNSLRKNIDHIQFQANKVLWLKKFGKPLYGINRKYVTSFFNS